MTIHPDASRDQWGWEAQADKCWLTEGWGRYGVSCNRDAGQNRIGVCDEHLWMLRLSG